MNQQNNLTKYVNQTPSVRFVILAAGTIIIIAAMYASASFLVPILLSVLFAVIFWPPLVWLETTAIAGRKALTSFWEVPLGSPWRATFNRWARLLTRCRRDSRSSS